MSAHEGVLFQAADNNIWCAVHGVHGPVLSLLSEHVSVPPWLGLLSASPPLCSPSKSPRRPNFLARRLCAGGRRIHASHDAASLRRFCARNVCACGRVESPHATGDLGELPEPSCASCSPGGTRLSPLRAGCQLLRRHPCHGRSAPGCRVPHWASKRKLAAACAARILAVDCASLRESRS